jgi:hypothetical protein
MYVFISLSQLSHQHTYGTKQNEELNKLERNYIHGSKPLNICQQFSEDHPHQADVHKQANAQ